MAASLTCGREVTPVLLRPCSSLRSAQLCTCHLPKQHAPPRHIPHWWGKFRSLSSVRSRPWFSSFGSLLGPAPLRPPVLSWLCWWIPCRQSASSFPALFISLWLHYTFSFAKRCRMLLTQYSSNKLTDLARLQMLQPMIQFRVSARGFWHLSQQQAATITAQHGPGPVTADGSFEAFCPRHGITRADAALDGHCRGSAKIGEQLLVALCDGDVPMSSKGSPGGTGCGL